MALNPSNSSNLEQLALKGLSFESFDLESSLCQPGTPPEYLLMFVYQGYWLKAKVFFFVRTRGTRGPLRPLILRPVYSQFDSLWQCIQMLQSAMSSGNFLAGLQRVRSPSAIPSINVFMFSVVFHFHPTDMPSFNFIFLIKSTTVQRLYALYLIIMLLTLSFQNTFSILWYHIISNARTFLAFEISGVSYNCPCLINIKQTRKTHEIINLGFYSQLAAAPQCVFNIPIR